VIDFDGVAPFQDFPTYSEDGFTLTTNIGDVRINDAFSPGNNAAQPSAGFGQGVDSSFTFINNHNMLFDMKSIDLLEATGYPNTFGVTMIATKSDFSTVSQTFTLDGIPGIETFIFSPEFTDLLSLQIIEDYSNPFFIDLVQIDNLVVSTVPEPSTLALLAIGGLGLLGVIKRKSTTH
jgi:hypothetical protein